MPELEKIPQTVTMDRVRATLDRLGISAMIDSDGDIGVHMFPHIFYFVQDDAKPFLGFSIFHRSIDVRFAKQASEFVAVHNREYYSPKLYTVMTDDGKIRFRVSYCFGWDAGATDEQVQDELDVFIRSTLETYGRLEHAFSDPWSLAARSEDSR